MEENGIEWDGVRDNLKIFEVSEKDFIGLGNPFQTRGSAKPRIEKVYVKNPLSKWYVALVVALVFMSGFFFVKSQTLNPVTEILSAREARCILEIIYSAELEPVNYRLLIDVFTEHLDNLFEIPFSLENSDKGVLLVNKSHGILKIHFIGERKLNPGDLIWERTLHPGGSLPISSMYGVNEVEIVDLETGTIYRIIIQSGEYHGRQH